MARSIVVPVHFFVIPAKAGIAFHERGAGDSAIPAFAGMTEWAYD